MICAEAGLINPSSYSIEGPADKSQKAFKLWVNDLATKYPELLFSYTTLHECWNAYSKER